MAAPLVGLGSRRRAMLESGTGGGTLHDESRPADLTLCYEKPPPTTHAFRIAGLRLDSRGLHRLVFRPMRGISGAMHHVEAAHAPRTARSAAGTGPRRHQPHSVMRSRSPDQAGGGSGMTGLEAASAVPRRPRTIRYSPGNTNRVSTVDDTIPPMTTVASGR